MSSTDALLMVGQGALDAADWQSARVCFETALSTHDSPEAHDGLGVALWWLNETEPAHRHRTLPTSLGSASGSGDNEFCRQMALKISASYRGM